MLIMLLLLLLLFVVVVVVVVVFFFSSSSSKSDDVVKVFNTISMFVSIARKGVVSSGAALSLPTLLLFSSAEEEECGDGSIRFGQARSS